MTRQKSELRVERFDALEIMPRFEYGEMTQVVETCGSKDGSELGTGWGRFIDARIPWTVRYDEVLTVFEGELRVYADGAVPPFAAQDSIWLPRGTELVYEARSALVHCAIHPSSRYEG
ncbi:MAG: ethanolamine utilization protein EutQ [Gammaproteobacteria bacterium]|nr:ethanolamine utilization protein EutQ [Gammaproteobacteria bacterium]MDH3448087.1 ethanolamine utilization protein EutQ [Gammaproteobacteria bacterium]